MIDNHKKSDIISVIIDIISVFYDLMPADIISYYLKKNVEFE
jgi:hypothetical protein